MFVYKTQHIQRFGRNTFSEKALCRTIQDLADNFFDVTDKIVPGYF